MSLIAYSTLLEQLKDKSFRDAFLSSSIRHRIALQIRAMRNAKPWSQKELGKTIGKPQNVISRLESPGYGRLSLQTLLELASAFNVGLVVKFARYSEMLKQTDDLSDSALVEPTFDQELEEELANQKLASSLFPKSPVYEAQVSTRACAIDFVSGRQKAPAVLGAIGQGQAKQPGNYV